VEGIILINLEIVNNQHDNKVEDTLWEKLNNTKSPHGTRLLQAWLLRPLFQKVDIDRRTNAVSEMLCSEIALCIKEARPVLSKR